MGSLRKFAKLSFAEQRLLVMTFLLVAAIRLGLSTLRLRRLQPVLDRIARHRLRFAAHGPSVAAIVWAVCVASDYVPSATCLTQALAAQVLMRYWSYPAHLRLGVNRSADGAFHAHAWVESQGTVVVGGPSDYVAQYIPLPSLECDDDL